MLNKKVWFLVIEFLILLFILFCVTSFYLSQTAISMFYNADLLYLPVVFQDLFYHGGHYIDWSLAPIPYFFPDWFIFAIAFVLSKQVYVQLLIVACLNVLLLYLAIRLIYQEFFSKFKAILFALTSLSIFIFLSIKYIQPFEAVFLPNIHVGSFTVGLFYIGIQLKLLAKQEINQCSTLLFFAVLISLATGMSDLLYILQFTLPVFLIYLFFFIKRRINYQQVLLFSFLPLLFSLFGGWLIKHIVHRSSLWSYLLGFPSINTFSFLSIKEDFSLFILNFLKKLSSFISLGFLIFYIGLFIIFFVTCFRKNKSFKLDTKIIFLTGFIFLSILIAIFSAGLESPAIRYIYPFFYFPILTFFWISYLFSNKIKQYWAYAALLIGFIFLILLAKMGFSYINHLKKDYYPDDIRCIDNALRGEGHKGIGLYWQAFPISMATKENVKVVPIQRNLSPFSFIANIKWFSNAYSFAVIYHNPPDFLKDLAPDENLIKKINGEPKKTILCGDKKLLIYPNNSLKTSYFVDSGDEFTWPASELPSQFSKSKVLDTRQVKTEDGIGFVTYGPNVPLTAGKYHIYITYASDAAASKQVAYWDIVSIKRGILSVKPLFGTNNEQKQIEATLEVPMNISEDSYQIRTYSSAHSMLIIKSLKLVKL